MRASGILLHISSLPSPYGIGTFGRVAYQFIDFLVAAKQTYWQILPLGHMSYGNSPYQTFSAFAGNPYFIDLDALVAEGLLKKSEIKLAVINPRAVDYQLQYENRFIILKKAFMRFDLTKDEYLVFKEKNRDWLIDYALFMAIKEHFNGISFQEWPDNIKKRLNKTIIDYSVKLKETQEFYIFLQYYFFKQWYLLKQYANKSGIKIIGDMPLYLALDSSDVWANPQIFDLNEQLVPNYVSGVPKDQFSDDGQLWGNPLYRFDVMAKDDYSFFVTRFKAASELYDYVRVDHFIGFSKYFNIDYQTENTNSGFWKKGPGYHLFKTVEEKLGKLNIIAEDLGNVDIDTKKLLIKTGFPGMKVLQFAFNAKQDSEYLPHHHVVNSICYTGTHDNETSKSWFNNLNKDDLAFCLAYINNNGTNPVDSLVKTALASVADTTIIPYQDYLGLDDEFRMNTPATTDGNWIFRTIKTDFNQKLTQKIAYLTKLYSRVTNHLE